MQNTDETAVTELQIRKLIHDQFEELRESVGDLLLMLEVKAIENEPSMLDQICNIIDGYAENIGRILTQARENLTGEIDRRIANSGMIKTVRS